ncbi:lipopolysaccharide biosynthesis protein [Peristeroidobacter soli]|uniref:lipopolysaccharide biosynthesis protein n=1 Tax=Peristeroidobacter soli TaxID=2497877 RepID=UPI00101B8B5A|nr:lipopolysaccharide biosynthesis protein [Peristeroidobacter soli]
MSAASLSERSFAAVMWSYAGGFARAFAQLGVQIVLARMLGPHVYGQFTIVLAVMGLGWYIAESGMGVALVQVKELTNDVIRQALGGVLMQGAVVAVVLFFGAPHLAALFDEPGLTGPLRACAGLVFLQVMGNISFSLMRRQFDMKRWYFIQVTAYVVAFGGVGIALAGLGAGVWSLVAGFATQSLITWLAAYRLVRHPLRPLFRMSADLRSFGMKVLGSALAAWAADNLERVVIGRVWGVASLGAYSIAQGLARAPATLLTFSVQSVALPMASRLQDDPERLRRAYCIVMGGLALILLPLFSLFAVAAQPLVLLLYGDRWNAAVPLLTACSVSVPFYVMAASTGTFLLATGAAGREAISQLMLAGALLAGFVVLGGLPLATAIWIVPAVYMLRAAATYLMLSRRIGLSHVRTFRALLGGIALAGVVVLAWEFSAWMPQASEVSTAALLRLVFVGGLAMLAVFASRGALFGPELRTVIRERMPSNRAGRIARRVLGL